MNTRNKRAAALSTGRPWLPTLPLPDGAISTQDRQQVSFAYFYAAAPVVGTPHRATGAIAISHQATGADSTIHKATGQDTP